MNPSVVCVTSGYLDCPPSFNATGAARRNGRGSERVHRHGCAIVCRITHMGHRTLWDVEDWLPPIAPSPVRVGDAVASRNIYAALYDSLLLCKEL